MNQHQIRISSFVFLSTILASLAACAPPVSSEERASRSSKLADTNPHGSVCETLGADFCTTDPGCEIAKCSAPEGAACTAEAVCVSRVSEALPPKAPPTCRRGGCGAESCSENAIATDEACVGPADACYARATCERQPGGACGFTFTLQLHVCLARVDDPNAVDATDK